MKLIRTASPKIISNTDLTLLCKAMVNIYHGRQLFQEDGSAVAGATLENTPEDYLSWHEGDIEYGHQPVRGFIYINSATINNKPLERLGVFYRSILDLFIAINTWGWRRQVNLTHISGANPFTVEKMDAELYANEMIISFGKPFQTRHGEYKFQWVVTSMPQMFQYTAAGKYLKPNTLMASLATIVIDSDHKIMDLENGYRTLSFPALTRGIKITERPIILSRYVGIDGHLYAQLGGRIDSKWSQFREFERVARDVEFWPQTEQKFVDSIDRLKTGGAANCDGRLCAACGIATFNEYYQVECATAVAAICKFCMHFNHQVNLELNTAPYRAAVAHAATTREQLISTVEMKDNEQHVVQSIHNAILQLEMEYVLPDNAALHFLSYKMASAVKVKGRNIFGFTSKSYPDVLNDCHKFPEGAYLFEYIRIW